MNGLWFDGHVLTLNEGGTSDRILVAERDIDGREMIWDQGMSRYSRIFRDTVPAERTYTVEVQLVGNEYTDMTRLESDWRKWHSWQVGRATLIRLTEDGYAFVAQCVAGNPEFKRKGFTSTVTQPYEFEVPFWRSREEKSASGAFNGVTPVNVACTNGGDIPAWIRVEVQGIIEDPKWEIGDYDLEFDIANTHANDLIEADCKPPATAYRTPNGGSQADLYGYRTAATQFGKMQLPVGTSNVVLSAASGTPTTTIYWHEWYNGLR